MRKFIIDGIDPSDLLSFKYSNMEKLNINAIEMDPQYKATILYCDPSLEDHDEFFTFLDDLGIPCRSELAKPFEKLLPKTKIAEDCYAEFKNEALIINRTDHGTWIALTEEQWTKLVEFMEDLEFRRRHE